MPSKILLIEDEEEIHNLIRYELKGGLDLVSAFSLAEGEKLLEDPNVYSAIVFDGCVPGNELNTIPLIQKVVKALYKGPVIAISSFEEYSKHMIEEGCTHISTKKDVGELINLLCN